MDLRKLPGVGEVTAKKLESHGIVDVYQLLKLSAPRIVDKTGLKMDSAKELIRKARIKLEKDSLVSKRFMTAKDVEVDDLKKRRISTGTNALDKLFNGGVLCGATTEVYGEFGCGKTQFCFTMAVRAQLPVEEGGLDGKVIYMDSEDTFDIPRVKMIAKELGVDPEQVIENIIVARSYNSVDQMMALEEADRMIQDGENNIKMLIIDSATGLFRQDYLGRGELSERQKYLNEFISLASNIARMHKIPVIYTNQVQISPDVFYGDPVSPIGGTILAHKSTFRVYFKKIG